MLRRIEAEQMVLAALGARYGDGLVAIAEDRTIERPFGWLFLFKTKGTVVSSRAANSLPRQVIVNRYSAQIIASSVEYTPEQFVKIYEELLAQHEAHEGEMRLKSSSPEQWKKWWERLVARRATQFGLYQISGKER